MIGSRALALAAARCRDSLISVIFPGTITEITPAVATLAILYVR